MKYTKRKSLSLKQKFEIIREIEQTNNQSAIVKRGVASSSAISRIWSQKEQIMTAYVSKPGKIKRLKNSKYLEIEEKLLIWFREIREKGIPISSDLLSQKAKDIAENLKIKNFVCCNGWLSRFKHRNMLTTGQISGESGSANTNNANAWICDKWQTLREKFRDENIFNADETGLFYKCTPKTTLKFKGEKCTGGKMSKERLTILLCCNSLGEKRPPLIIGKHAMPRCFKGENISHFNYVSNKKAWMTSSIFTNYLLKWDSELRLINRRILLILDNCSAHPDICSKLTNIKLCFLPPNTTSLIQPLDQGIIKSFKVHYRKTLTSKILQSAELNENFKITVFDALKYILQSWNLISEKTIQNCFAYSKIIQRNIFF